MPDTSTTYLGLDLRSPLVASSSPLTGNLDDLRRLEDAGAAAAVLPSIFEELVADGDTTALLDGAGAGPPGPDPAGTLELLRQAKEALEIPVIGSLNGTTPGGWLEYAKRIEQAGADALELNLYLMASDPQQSSQEIEARCRELVAGVRDAVGIPLAVKLGPYFTAFARTATELVGCGADGLVLFNRFYQPDVDLELLDAVPRLVLSRSEEMRLPLRWIASLHGRLDASLAVTTGVHTAEDVLKAILAGADATMLASALLEEGPDWFTRVERDLLEWMDERGAGSIRALRGSAWRPAADPAAYERANYLRELRSWSRRPGA